MFQHLLSGEQRELFLRAAIEIANADGEHGAAERELTDAIAAESGVETFPSDGEWGEVLDRMGAAFSDTPASARALLLELAGVAIVDGHEDPREREVLLAIASAVDLTPEDVKQYLEFAQRAAGIAAEARALITTSTSRS